MDSTYSSHHMETLVSRPASKRAASEDEDHPPQQRQDTRDDNGPEQDIYNINFTAVNNQVGDRATTVLTVSDGRVVEDSVARPAADEDDIEMTDDDTDPDQGTDTTSTPYTDDKQPHANETIADYCLRMKYIPSGTPIPDTNLLLPFLALRPVRELVYNPGARNQSAWARNKGRGRYCNWYALFIQVGGRVAANPCDRCAKGRTKWLPSCVVPRTDDTAKPVKGACACCVYNNLGSKCSFVNTFHHEDNHPSAPSTPKAGSPRPSSNADEDLLHDVPPEVQHLPTNESASNDVSDAEEEVILAVEPEEDDVDIAALMRLHGQRLLLGLPGVSTSAQRNAAELQRSRIKEELRATNDELRANAVEQLRLTHRQAGLIRRLEELGEEQNPYHLH